MRLDKYLKVARIIKRRTVAKEVADLGRVAVNEKEAKASTIVKVGDTLTIRFGGSRIFTIKIESILENAKKEQAALMYTVISDQKTTD